MDKPTTVEECMMAFDEMFSAEERAKIARMDEDEVGRTHHGLGQCVRNNWGLWSGGALLQHMTSLGFIHADDMSSSLIKEYWNRLRNKPSEMSKDIKEYGKYWDELKSEREMQAIEYLVETGKVDIR